MNLIGQKKISKDKKEDLIFYFILIIIPIVQFCIFYIGVNFNSILLSFKDISINSEGEYVTKYTFDTLKKAFDTFFSSEFLSLGKMSILSYLITVGIGVPLSLLFSFYIYKNFFGSGAFRVLLFMPSVISNLVIVLIFQFFVERALPDIMYELTGDRMDGLLSNIDTRYATLMFFNLWVSFGVTTLLYSNGMSAVSTDLVEAAQLDGVTNFQEFIYISLPTVFPTLQTFLIAGVAGIFTNQISLFSFYGDQAPETMQTFGYYLYMKIQQSKSFENEYPLLAAMGLILTFVAVPLTMLVKFVLDKLGPSED